MEVPREQAGQCCRPAATWLAASARAPAHAAENLAFFPFASRVAVVPDRLRALLALSRSFRAFVGGLVAAWSMRVSALVNFAVTLAGMA